MKKWNREQKFKISQVILHLVVKLLKSNKGVWVQNLSLLFFLQKLKTEAAVSGAKKPNWNWNFQTETSLIESDKF